MIDRNARQFSSEQNPAPRTQNPTPQGNKAPVQPNRSALEIDDYLEEIEPEPEPLIKTFCPPEHPGPTTGRLEGTLGVDEADGASDERTFFYPGALRDYAGLFRLSHMYDRFVFCDLSMAKADIIRSFVPGRSLGFQRQYEKQERTDLLRVESVQELEQRPLPTLLNLFDQIEMSEDEKWQYLRYRDHSIDRDADWGYRIRLTRQLGQHQRRITLYYLRTEGSATFAKLFAERNSAPGGLCIQNYFNDMGLRGEDTLLARVAQTTDRRPTHLFGSTGWPDQGHWQSFGAGWRNMEARTAIALPPSESQIFERGRKIILSPDRLDQAVHDDVQAVMSTPNILGDRQLPQGVEFIPFSRVGSNRPMVESLSRLERLCTERRIAKIATLPFGLEDEGIVLRDWALKTGWPEEIHIHCPSPGDAHSLDIDSIEARMN